MLCPRCNKNTLEEREREGITIDICQECRGIWLDRGELERLIARATQDMDRQAGTHDRPERYRDSHDDHHDRYRDRHDDHHKHHDHHDGHEGSHYRKRHWLAELFD